MLDAVTNQPAIFCVQKAAKKKVCTEQDFIKADKLSFGDEIGSITNRITTMFDVLAKFEPGSKEYQELEYRIMTGQNYQQNSIDKSKGIISKSMPKEWYSAAKNKIKEDDTLDVIKEKEFNMSILADKKPYFFIYNYPHLMKELNDVRKGYNEQSMMEFGFTIEELVDMENLTEEQQEVVGNYKRDYPVHENDCVMNRICWKLEEELDVALSKRHKIEEFDYDLMKSNKKYSDINYNKIKTLYTNYRLEVLTANTERSFKIKRSGTDDSAYKQKYVDLFKEEAEKICSNKFELCNIMVDLVKENKVSSQFTWAICEDTIIENLLDKNGNKFKCLVQEENGEVDFAGKRFTVKEKIV